MIYYIRIHGTTAERPLLTALEGAHAVANRYTISENEIDQRISNLPRQKSKKSKKGEG